MSHSPFLTTRNKASSPEVRRLSSQDFSAPVDYPDTANWAVALHRHCPDGDGLFWMLRQRDRDQALVLFGDSVGSALTGTRVSGALRVEDALRQAVIALALRVGIEASRRGRNGIKDHGCEARLKAKRPNRLRSAGSKPAVSARAGFARASLITAVRRDDDPTPGAKKREGLHANRVEVEREADDVDIRLHAATTVKEACEEMLETA